MPQHTIPLLQPVHEKWFKNRSLKMPEDTLEGKQLTKKCTHCTQNIVYKQLFKKKYVCTEVSHISALNIAVLPLLLKACWDGALTTSGGNEFQLSDAKQV